MRLGLNMGYSGSALRINVPLVQEADRLGFHSVWSAEAYGSDAVTTITWVAALTKRIYVGTAIMQIPARTPTLTATTAITLDQMSEGRFLLGLGVSHVPLVEGLRGHRYGKPVETMRDYVDAMRRASYAAPRPPEAPKTVIAALGPGMLALAGSHTDGAHPYLVSPEHTKEARHILGPDRLLCPEQTVLAETDPGRARRIGRAWLGRYLEMTNYRNNLLRLGFGTPDFAGGGSDRLVDAMIVWGDAAAIRGRIDEHWAAGADHVCIQALNPDEAAPGLPDERLLAALAPKSQPGH